MADEFIKLIGKPHDLGGGFTVSRVLPQAKKRMVGPFIFFDHMGPVDIKANQNIDVRPHPHIGLSTLTYLLEGRMVHRDSLGSDVTIVPGDVNWMTAGSGISHSERAHADDKPKDRRMQGLQFWIALPDHLEDVAPSFAHYDQSTIPRQENPGYRLSLVSGHAFGLKSPVQTSSPLLLASIAANADGSSLEFKFENFEIGVYVISGQVRVGVSGEIALQEINKQEMLILNPNTQTRVEFDRLAQFIILGGEPFKSPRHMWWNLVSSSREKIEAAKLRWKNGTFPMVPGETEFIPAPEF